MTFEAYHFAEGGLFAVITVAFQPHFFGKSIVLVAFVEIDASHSMHVSELVKFVGCDRL